LFARQVELDGQASDEPFWRFVQDQFSIAPDRIYLNNGTLGPAPRLVLDATLEHERRVAATYPPGVDWDALKPAVSDLLGGDPSGWTFPRNTTEAINFVANGMDLPPGAEIVITDHEHIGGKSAWELLAARRGVVVRTATLPVPARSGREIEAAILAQVTSSTRVVCVSHVTFTTGTRLPIETLATTLAEAGITVVVDGAHPPGMLQIDVGELGGDFYGSSPHKWLLAPQGTGLLYLAAPWRDRLWPTLASGGWDDEALGAHRLNHLGTFDESRLAGLAAALAFHQALGPARVEARVRYLNDLLVDWLSGVPGLEVMSSPDPTLRSGMVSFVLTDVRSLDLQSHLARIARVRTRVISEYGYEWMRLSAHVYNDPSELERVVALIHDVARSGIGA